MDIELIYIAYYELHVRLEQIWHNDQNCSRHILHFLGRGVKVVRNDQFQ